MNQVQDVWFLGLQRSQHLLGPPWSAPWDVHYAVFQAPGETIVILKAVFSPKWLNLLKRHMVFRQKGQTRLQRLHVDEEKALRRANPKSLISQTVTM